MTEENGKQKKWIDNIYLLHENELLLNEQAAKGQILKDFDKDFAYFTEAAAEDIKYKIVILDKKKAVNQIKIIEHQGFTFVGSYKEYYIFYIKGRYGHIEPRLNEEMVEFVRKWFNKQLIKRFTFAIIALVPIIVKLIIIIDQGKLLQSIVEFPTIWYVVLGFIFTASIIDSIRGYRAIITTKKCFLEHEEYLLRRNSKMSKAMRTFIISICILAGISLLKGVYFDADQYSINDVQKVMPIVLIQDIDQDEERWELTTDSQSTVNEDNYAEIKHTLLAPKQYHAWEKNPGNYMTIYYYEVVDYKLAEPLARELPISEFADIKKEDIKKVDFRGLDAVYTWQAGDILNVSACKGKRVMYIFNIGDIQIEDVLREMAEVL